MIASRFLKVLNVPYETRLQTRFSNFVLPTRSQLNMKL